MVIENQSLDLVKKFTESRERKLAKDLVKRYLEDFSLETISDRNTLKEVIYYEVVQNRLQEKLNHFYEKDSKAVPMQLIDTLHKNSEMIIKLKNTLKLTRVNEKGGYDALAHLKKRAKVWREENQGSRTIKCPHCQQFVLLKIRTAEWEAQKHPYFKDRILANKHLVRLYNEGRVNRTDVAAILECSENYVDWLIEKWAKINEPTKEASVAESEAFSESSENDSSTSSSRFSDSSSSESLIPKETLINVDKKVDVESSSSL